MNKLNDSFYFIGIDCVVLVFSFLFLTANLPNHYTFNFSFSSIQSMYCCRLVYIPGDKFVYQALIFVSVCRVVQRWRRKKILPGTLGRAQPMPYATIPIWYHANVPLECTGNINGPPESPTHESFPPSKYPAHRARAENWISKLSLSIARYFSLHRVLLRTGTCNCCMKRQIIRDAKIWD